MLQQGSKYSWLIHFGFWTIAIVFLTYFFGYYNKNYKYTILFVCLQLPVIIATTYTINYWLVPEFLFKGRTGRFIYFLLGLLVVSAWLNALITIFSAIFLYQYNFEFLPPAWSDFKMLTAGLYLVILMGVAIHFTRESLKQSKAKFKLEKQQIETTLALNETRLKLLQNQLHPHMLFNSLNTIYGLALNQSDKTPKLILNLSNMLDYMLYQCNNERIVLEKEIDYIKNYIEIEKNRIADNPCLEFTWPEHSEKYMIAPLILLPFVENCFKHSGPGKNNKTVIKIICSIDNLTFTMKTCNTFVSGQKRPGSRGIGISNAKERLELQYPGNYSLKSGPENDEYQVLLTLQLDLAEN